MTLTFLLPWAGVLAAPLLLAWWLWGRHNNGRIIRLLLIALCVSAAMIPLATWGTGGSDVILVLDRSLSMGPERAQQDELIRLAAEQRAPGDQLGVITVADGADILQAPQHSGMPQLSNSIIADQASSLHEGLAYASSLLAPGRSGRVILHSDGEYTGRNPQFTVASLRQHQAILDVIDVHRPPQSDAAILQVEMPSMIRLGESFLGAVQFISDRHEERSYTITRGQTLLSKGTLILSPDTPFTVSFADRPIEAGLAEYSIHLDHTNDRRIGNNTARAVTRIIGGEQVCIMSTDGTAGAIHRVLEAAGMRVMSIPEGPIALEQLSACSVLILDQVPAQALGRSSMLAIQTWVHDLGGGLIMCGGRRSFGAGGYHKSPLEEVLPVTMELRDEHRKLSVALAITLDRSGSMSASTASGRTKMHLADEGAAAAVELLGPRDQIAVHAVDSQAHVIIPLTAVENPHHIINHIMGIESMGGGIFVYEALAAAGEELLRSDSGSRHLVLFSDAADSEEPGNYKQLLADFQQAGITVSVIGLGSEQDVDAALLKDIALHGGGRIHFTEQAEDLPRLFAQETVLIARTAWVDEHTPVRVEQLQQLILGQQAELKQWPHFPGYNVTYPKPQAHTLATVMGDPAAPAACTIHSGNGRSAILATAWDDAQSQTLLNWDGYAPLTASLTRWCAGKDDTAPGHLVIDRQDNYCAVRIELDPTQPEKWDGLVPQLSVIDTTTQQTIHYPLYHSDSHRWTGSFTLDHDHIVICQATIGNSPLPGPALCIPYAAEYRPTAIHLSGHDTLLELATLGGGVLRSDMIGIFDNPPSAGFQRHLGPYLLALALIILLIEITVRRLHLSLWKKRSNIFKVQQTKQVNPEIIEEKITDVPQSTENTNVKKAGGMHEALNELRKKRR